VGRCNAAQDLKPLVLDDVFGERAGTGGRIGSAIEQAEFEV
jgi:hypothetical protein